MSGIIMVILSVWGVMSGLLGGQQLASSSAAAAARPASGVVFAVDVSGNMAGEGLASEVAAVRTLVGQLDAAVPVALVSYGSRVQVMVGQKQVGDTGWALAQLLDLGDLAECIAQIPSHELRELRWIDVVTRLVPPRELPDLVLEPERAEEVVGLLERPGMCWLESPELGSRAQPLDRPGDIGAGL